MFSFTRYVLLFTSLLPFIFAVPLVKRDVVDPPITSPTAGTVWHVGQTQTVTWNATGLPVYQTNPVGMLVLGYLFNNSENLMLSSPLATGLNYSVGQAQITVPNVPSRTDYIVVLFGDSGNASPEFTIINDGSSSGSVPTPTVPTTSTPTTPMTPTTPTTPMAPGGNPPSASPPSSPAPTPANLNPASSRGSSPTSVSGSLATPTAPASHTTSHSSSSTVVIVTSTHTPSPTQSSAAWHIHVPSLGTPLSVALAVIYFTFS